MAQSVIQALPFVVMNKSASFKIKVLLSDEILSFIRLSLYF